MTAPLDFGRFKLLTFDCYGTLIDWETGIERLTRPWLDEMKLPVPTDLILTCFALMQAKHQQVRPALLYPEVLRRTWRDIENTFGWPENPGHAHDFVKSVGKWLPYSDTVEALGYLGRFYKLAILSNVDNASLAETRDLLRAPFSFTITAEDVGSYKPGAPHFDEMIRRARQQGIELDEILHVAQSKHHDINPGREMGLTTVWVNRRHGKPGSGATLATEARPHLTVTSLAELTQMHKASQVSLRTAT